MTADACSEKVKENSNIDHLTNSLICLPAGEQSCTITSLFPYLIIDFPSSEFLLFYQAELTVMKFVLLLIAHSYSSLYHRI